VYGLRRAAVVLLLYIETRTRSSGKRGGAISTGEILYYDLFGVILVFTADIFGLWEPWAAVLTRVFERIHIRRSR
jgi:hypothetical protein